MVTKKVSGGQLKYSDKYPVSKCFINLSEEILETGRIACYIRGIANDLYEINHKRGGTESINEKVHNDYAISIKDMLDDYELPDGIKIDKVVVQDDGIYLLAKRLKPKTELWDRCAIHIYTDVSNILNFTLTRTDYY